MVAVQNSKLTVVGAGGVGTSLAFAALIRGSANEVALYDIATAKVEAEVLDLAHGTQFTSAAITGGDDPAVIEGSNIIVVTAGAKQQPGQTRMDLVGTNVRILENMLPVLLERAPEATIILVSNPVDVLTLAAQKITGLPTNRVFGSGTVLDTSRFRWLLAKRAGVSTSSVHADIVGEHGDTEFPLWSNARIGAVPIEEWGGGGVFSHDEFDDIAHEVRTAAYKVIEGKGATNYAIGISAARIVEAVLNDERAVLPVSTVFSGLFGLNDVALSVPSIVGADGAVALPETPFSDEELGLLRASGDAIRTVADSVGI